MFNVRRVSLGLKRKLYEGVVVPSVTYGAETWDVRMDKKRQQDDMSRIRYSPKDV